MRSQAGSDFACGIRGGGVVSWRRIAWLLPASSRPTAPVFVGYRLLRRCPLIWVAKSGHSAKTEGPLSQSTRVNEPSARIPSWPPPKRRPWPQNQPVWPLLKPDRSRRRARFQPATGCLRPINGVRRGNFLTTLRSRREKSLGARGEDPSAAMPFAGDRKGADDGLALASPKAALIGLRQCNKNHCAFASSDQQTAGQTPSLYSQGRRLPGSAFSTLLSHAHPTTQCLPTAAASRTAALPVVVLRTRPPSLRCAADLCNPPARLLLDQLACVAERRPAGSMLSGCGLPGA